MRRSTKRFRERVESFAHDFRFLSGLRLWMPAMPLTGAARMRQETGPRDAIRRDVIRKDGRPARKAIRKPPAHRDVLSVSSHRKAAGARPKPSHRWIIPPKWIDPRHEMPGKCRAPKTRHSLRPPNCGTQSCGYLTVLTCSRHARNRRIIAVSMSLNPRNFRPPKFAGQYARSLSA
jgi:hypothetical protein